MPFQRPCYESALYPGKNLPIQSTERCQSLSEPSGVYCADTHIYCALFVELKGENVKCLTLNDL